MFAKPAFEGFKALNRIQSRLYKVLNVYYKYLILKKVIKCDVSQKRLTVLKLSCIVPISVYAKLPIIGIFMDNLAKDINTLFINFPLLSSAILYASSMSQFYFEINKQKF